ncbi:phosphoribosylanthranilate isomerase [Cysteiniphilum halobium]|uniref:phosphoribosylanthranilate isomerase n=1 Tax=Cysteiniphilum halobium TaxID=2219059 RepID=UPI000E656069|nr:phosphoribosylanthranilate isomerase [Cysteiniphilum halobium]
MHTARIKVCGITNLDDALYAIDCGVDALGFVFYSKSPRFIDIPKAKQIISQLPPFVSCCGLFVNAKQQDIQAGIDANISLIQFHGDETATECDQFDFPYIRAIRAKDSDTLIHVQNAYPNARGLLIDSYSPTLYGGSGKTFDWSTIPNDMRQKIILAGGLTADNVHLAIEMIKPYAVDVSGGVESQKGIKCRQKVKAFCNAVRSINITSDIND